MKKVTEIGYDTKDIDFSYAYPCFGKLAWVHTWREVNSNIREIVGHVFRLVEGQMFDQACQQVLEEMLDLDQGENK